MRNAECGSAPLSQARVDAKHHYRFKYLKSEHWSNLRIAKLASVDAKCRKCGHRNLSNDVHHLRYRKLYDVQLEDLVVLCRECHDLAHDALDVCREKIKTHENPWKVTEIIMAILDASRAFQVDCSFLERGELGKNVTQFWKEVKKVRATSEAIMVSKARERIIITSAMNGCMFPEYQYFMFDCKGRKI